MKIIEVKASLKPLWEDYNQKSPHSSFLQSFAWGDFQKNEGVSCYRFALEKAELDQGLSASARLIGLAQIFRHPLPLGKSYLYLPHGPIIDEKFDEEEAWKLLLDKSRQLAKKEKAIFLLAEPKQTFNQVPFLKKSNKHLQAETTLILNVSPTKKEILEQMKGKTRYNINLAKRKGIKIYISRNLDDVSIFLNLAKKTSRRDEFKLHPDEYYRGMLKDLSNDSMIELLLARYQKKWVAAILVLYYGQLATYLHGASDYHYRNLMAPHLLQWTAIRRAKKRGCKFYDFWGVTTNQDPNHHWAGFTRFKLGFAPHNPIIEYPGPYEYVFDPAATMGYKFLQKILGRR